MMRPIINLNGTSAEQLIATRMTAREAILDAITALKATAPNGRDYIGDIDRHRDDREIYGRRITGLHELYNELMIEAEYIQESLK